MDAASSLGELNQDVDNHTSAPAPVLGSAGERSEHVKVSLKPPADDRLLRIGYLSADFRLHPVGYLLEPVWQAHDRQRWQVVAYANSLILDQHTACLRELADEWHWVAHESDADLAERIRRDRIDVLIDLSGHTGGNRLQVFRERPARLQASWFGYSSTTGLAQIDHVICDAWTVPPHDEPYFSERTVEVAAVLCLFSCSTSIASRSSRF